MIPSTANALKELFNHSKYSLSPEELDWYGELDEAAACEATNMALILSALGTLYTATDDKSQLPSGERLGAIFWSLSDKTEIINALNQVSNEAAYLAEKKRKESTDIKKPA